MSILASKNAGRMAALWGGAAMLALVGHVSAGYIVKDLGIKPPSAAQEAMEIDLMPVVIDEPAEEAPEQPLVEETPPEEIVEEQDQPVEEEVAEATPEEPEIIEETPEEPEPVEEETVEETPAPKPAVVLPKKEKPKPKVEKPKPKREQPKKPAPERKPPQQASAPSVSKAPTIDPSRWNSQVRSAVARRVPRNSKAQGGRVVISFTVTSSGSIASASIRGSSGDSAYDNAALAAIKGARVPAPPAGVSGAALRFTLPIIIR